MNQSYDPELLTERQVADLLAGAERYAPVGGEVEARQLETPRTWVTARGQELQAEAGDWLVTSGNDQWTVVGDIFAKTYQQVGPGRFAKTAKVEAVQVPKLIRVKTLEGEAVAHAGDWLLRGVSGEVWPVTHPIFVERYRLIKP